MLKELITSNLILNPPSLADITALKDFESRNQDHLVRWESTTVDNPNAQLSPEETTQKKIETWITECEEGRSVRFFMRLKGNRESIIGLCNFTQIYYGSFQACYLGYKIDYEYEGKGLMFEALEACVDYVFVEQGIHRIMANYMPINTRSANLLKRLGFTTEGYAKKYLQIKGQWEDHVLAALSVEEWNVWSSLRQESPTICNIKKSSLIPELTVLNYRKSLEFYTQLTGFQILYERFENEFAMLEKDGSQLMIEGFSNKNRSWILGEIKKPLGQGMHFQIEVPDIQSLYQNFKTNDYPIFFEMEEKWYRVDEEEVCHQQFLVQDPDGYLLRFFENKGTRRFSCDHEIRHGSKKGGEWSL